MSHSGQSTINFGGYPGSVVTSTFVTAPTISVLSMLDAWINPSSGTVDHTSDEHLIEKIRLYASNIIDNSGFTLTAYGYSDSPQTCKQVNNNTGKLYGQWNVAWAFN